MGLSPARGALPPLLLGPNSDIALAFGLAVDRSALPVIASTRVTLGVVAVGMGAAELVRSRYGLRLAGVIVLPLVVLAAFRNAWLLPTWVVATAVVSLGVTAVHRWTLLYGRVLLAVGVIFGLLVVILLTAVVPTVHGLLPFFVGLFAGVTAYNLHVVAPAERPATVAASLAVLVLVTLVARLAVVPAPRGLLRVVAPVHLLAGGLALVPAAVALGRLEWIRPRGVDRERPGSVPRGDQQ